jgi:hypothetical protein
MANRYWVGGSATWDSTAGTKWATTSGGTGGAAVPTTSDDVFLDGSSGVVTVTVSGTAGTKSLNCTGFTGTLAGTSTINMKESMTLSSGMTNTLTGGFVFNGATSATITTAGIHVQRITVNGTGTWTLQDNVTFNATGVFEHTNGIIDFNGKSVSGGRSFSSTGSNTRSMYLKTSQLTFSESWTVSGSNCTVVTNGNANVSTIILDGSGVIFTGGDVTYDSVKLFGVGTAIVKGQNTFVGLQRVGTLGSKTDKMLLDADQNVTSLSGINGLFAGSSPNAVDRVFVGSTVKGVRRLVSLLDILAVFQGNSADFQDIEVSPSADISASGLNGDCGNNLYITFPAGGNQYWRGDTGNFSDSSKWTGSGRFPLPQDTAIFDSSSFTGTGKTVTFDLPRVSGLNWTGVTNSPAMYMNYDIECYGNMTFSSTVAITGAFGADTFIYAGGGTSTLTSNGITLTGLDVDCGAGTLQLGDTLSCGTLTGLSGTLDAGTQNVNISSGLYYDITDNTRILTMGSGDWTLSGVGPIATFDATNLTLNRGTSKLVVSNLSSTPKTIAGGGATFYDLDMKGATGVGALTLTGANTFHNVKLNKKTSIVFPAGVTTTMATLQAVGVAGQIITITSSSAGTAATISAPSGTINCDYLSLKDSAATGGATWHAGANSTNVSGNSGWLFP